MRPISLRESLDEEQIRVPYEPGINPPIREIGHDRCDGSTGFRTCVIS